MTHICISKLTIIHGSENGLWPGRRHYLNQCLNIVNLNHRNKFQWDLKQISYIFFQENLFQNVTFECIHKWLDISYSNLALIPLNTSSYFICLLLVLKIVSCDVCTLMPSECCNWIIKWIIYHKPLFLCLKPVQLSATTAYKCIFFCLRIFPLFPSLPSPV